MRINNITKPWNLIFKAFIVFSSVLLTTSGFSQNTSVKTFSADGISEIVIDATQIFSINVTVTDQESIIVSSLSDGEYGNKFQVDSRAANGILSIGLRPISMESIPDDKRNAHKVVAAEVAVSLPANKSISIKSDIGSVDLNGKFNEVIVDLDQGSFTANATVKEAMVRTITGHIFIKTKDAVIETDSQSGNVDIPNDLLGFSLWKLQTKSGNITVKK